MLEEKAHCVIVVDDNRNIARMVSSVFREYGYLTYTAFDPNIVLYKFIPWMLPAGRGISLLLTDQQMPHLTGLQLIKQVRTIDPTVNCALMTAADSATLQVLGDELRSLNGPEVRLLSKPFEIAVLDDLARRL